MKYFKKTPIKKIISTLTLSLSLILAGCATTKKSETIEVINKTSTISKTSSEGNKKSLLADKLYQADFSVRAMDDKEFIDVLSKSYTITEAERTCVFENMDREDYKKLFSNYADMLVKKDPDIIESDFKYLDFLAKVMNVFYDLEQTVVFNNGSPDEFLASPAFQMLTPEDASKLKMLTQNDKYSPLLSTIGMPARLENGEYFDFAEYAFLRLHTYTAISATKCGLNK